MGKNTSTKYQDSQMSIIAFIPARSGSQRFPRKNYYDLWNGYNMSQVMALKCLKANVFDRIIITSDDVYFDQCAKDVGVEFYLRDPKYATPQASSDWVTEHLFDNFDCELGVKMQNPNPLQSIDEIKLCVETLKTCDTVMPVVRMYKQALYLGTPLNYESDNPHAQTQDLEPYFQWSYSCFGHRRETYMRERWAGKGGMLFGDIKYPEVSWRAALAIKTEQDFKFMKAAYASTMQGELDV